MAVTVCAAVCSCLLLIWIGLQVSPRAKPQWVDLASGACFLALGLTSVVVFGAMIVAPAERSPMPIFVFFGAPIGFYLAWLSWRLARAAAPRG